MGSCGLNAGVRLPEVSVQGTRPEQLGVGSGGDDSPLLHHRDAIRHLDGGRTVGDDERGAPFAEADQRGADPMLRRGIEGGGRFVEDEDGGVLQERPGEGETLALPPERSRPFSPTTESSPSGRSSRKSVTNAASAACRMDSREADSSPP